MKKNKHILREFLKHGAAEQQAEEYIRLIERLAKFSAVSGQPLEYHHILPRECGWWKKYKDARWNLVGLSRGFHECMHGFLLGVFPKNESLAAAVAIFRGKGKRSLLTSRENEVRALAGTMTQKQAAKKLGVPHHTVTNFCHTRKIKWPWQGALRDRETEVRALAGTMTKTQAAKRLGVSFITLWRFCFTRKIIWPRWSSLRDRKDEVRALAGTMTKKQAAKRLGVSFITLWYFCFTRKIIWPRWSSLRDRKDEVRALAGTMTKKQAAKKLGVSYHTLTGFCRTRKIKWLRRRK